MRCSYCSRRAAYFSRHFGKAFCARHLHDHLLRKLRRTLVRHRLVRRGEPLSIDEAASPADAAARKLFVEATEGWQVELGGGTRVRLDSLDCETARILDALSRGELYFPDRVRDGIAPFIDFDTKALFTLGWIMGFRGTGKKRAPLLSLSAKLNLLKTWSRVHRALELPGEAGVQDAANRGAPRKGGE